MRVTSADLRRFAVSRSLFQPTTLTEALRTLEFVQADPIRAPARAQDLMLRHRVTNYRAGDLEHRYPELDVEEDYFINYGYVSRSLYANMHPRTGMTPWPRSRRQEAAAILDFVRERDVVHPREVDEHFRHGTTRNYWGGTSNATTHLLDAMHYRGLLRVAGRSAGIRLYAAREESHGRDRRDTAAAIDILVDALVRLYGPVPRTSLSRLVSRLRLCVPQWHAHLRPALRRAQDRLAHAKVEGIEWYWPAGESPAESTPNESVRLLAPFDPIVWDRLRFELLWNWTYRFEAYTPLAKRKLGYYAMPLLWRDRVIGWSNVAVKQGRLQVELGYTGNRAPRERSFRQRLDEELQQLSVFLSLDSNEPEQAPDTYAPA
jgi:uncharacterized protein